LDEAITATQFISNNECHHLTGKLLKKKPTKSKSGRLFAFSKVFI